MNHHNRPFPTPFPEPPRVVSTRLTVPDLSISSDIESTCFKQKQVNNRRNARFETPFPRNDENRFVSPRQPLKTSPIINKHYDTKRSQMEVAEMLKQHDQQLQLISKQIEKLLQLTSERQPKPSTCSVETMTSNVWPTKSKAKECPPRKSKLEEVREVSFESRYSEVECARGGENDDDYYDRILTNIDEMLNSSGSDTSESLSDPVVEERIIHKRDRRGRESAHQMSSETLYIKRLASKYLVCERESPPAVERKKKSSYRPKLKKDLQVYGIAQEVSSVATKNYLQKYGLVNRPQDFSPSQGLKAVKKGNRILDLENLKRQPKFV